MNPLLLLAMFGRKLELQTVTFNANATWVAPAGVTLLASVIGHGVNGTPDTTYTEPSTYTLTTTGTEVFDNGASTGSVTTTVEPATATSSVPAYFCYPFTEYTLNGHFNRTFCYEYSKQTIPGASGGSPATTGANATGFGITFPGGVGGTAPTTTYNNVAVTPATSYPLVVPSGATIQITYYA